MYFWNVDKLAEDFQEGRVDEKERFKYYFAYMVTLAAVQLLESFHSHPYEITDLISGISWLVITGIGILLCYRTNRNGDNNDFVGRMICLTWPIGIKLLVFAVPTGILFVVFYKLVLYFSFWAMGGGLSSPVYKKAADPTIPIVVWFVLFGIVYYWMTYSYLTRVAHYKIE
jgi:hypothetical protein